MHIDAESSPDSAGDPEDNWRKIYYINAVWGYALILTVVVFLITSIRCCMESDRVEITREEDENASNAVFGVNTRSRAVGSTETQNHRRAHSSTSSYEMQTKSKGSSEFPKPKGLVNNKNTCYFNSMMQALNQTTILEKQLGEVREPDVMIKAIKRFYASMHGRETSAVDPEGLQKLMIQRTGKFNFGIQHDSHECFLNVLQELRKDERQSRGDPLTVVDKIFGGHCMTVYTCKMCGTPSHLCEPFLDISLPIHVSNPWKSRRRSAERPPGDVSNAPPRPLPPLHRVEQGSREHHKSSVAWGINEGDTSNRDTDDGDKDREHTKHNHKRHTEGRSGDRSTASKIRKTEPMQKGSRFAEPEITQRSAYIEPDPKEAYKIAVSSMMTTLSEGPSSKPTDSNPNSQCTLDDCFRCYTREEDIMDEYLCRECNLHSDDETRITLTSATKRTLIFNPPAVLTIHLKRFENKRKEYVKRTTMVGYDEVLDIGPYCSAWVIDQNDQPSQNIWYSLYAVVVHSGSLQSGHYIAFVKAREYDENITQFLQKTYLNRDNITVEFLIQRMKTLKSRRDSPCIERPSSKDGTWYCMNDRNVSKVSEKVALDQEAFLLFYERL